jgi:diadenosine tetraphosphate (Ap4A) HIT family hydrolase
MKARPAAAWSLHPQLDADSHPVASFGLSELRLMDDANYPWLVLVPRVPDARELIDLPPAQQAQLLEEIGRVSRLLQELFRPHKLNVAALGNMVPQLHVHVIARQTDDPAWPSPVWGRVEARAYEPEALVDRVRRLRAALTA